MQLKPATLFGFVASALFYWNPAFATIDMKNGNYTESYIDAQSSGTGYSLRVHRAYNSRSVFSGMYGFGWCSDFETSIEKTPEGHLKLQECGAGQEFIYRLSSKTAPAVLDSTIDAIATYYKKSNPAVATETVATLKDQLRNDTALRIRWAKQAGIEASDPKKGMVYTSDSLEIEKVEFDGTQYTRTLADGTSQRFNASGKLTAMYDKNGNSLKLVYSTEGLKEVIDNTGKKLTFVLYPSKRVKEITGPNNIKVEYKYKGEDLSEVKNMWKNTYIFEYDENHNMTKVVFPDNSTKLLTYNQKADWVTSFTDRALEGMPACKETYEYDADKANPKDHFWSTAVKKCGTDTKLEAKFEFWLKNRADGKRYLHRVLNRSLTDTLDVTYHPEFGRPTIFKKNALTTTFTYYSSGLVKEKSTGATRIQYEYKNGANKVSKAVTEFFDLKGKVSKKRVTTFSYDARGNLTSADNTDGQSVKLTYDQRGRIATIVDQAKKEVHIKYEERTGRPAQITRPKLGSIALTYKSNGQISNVDSSDGPTVATQVASTFNNLLDIIEPATSELNL